MHLLESAAGAPLAFGAVLLAGAVIAAARAGWRTLRKRKP